MSIEDFIGWALSSFVAFMVCLFSALIAAACYGALRP